VTIAECPVCELRDVAPGDTVCGTCREFIVEFIDTGLIPKQPVPMVADVAFVMRRLGVDQDRAVIALGGIP
jgi:hypothetical protein